MTDNKPRTLRSVCVYCGSSPGKDERFVRAARDLGQALARENIGLVYGGGDRGLMGAVAGGALEGGGHVTGIIPQFLMNKERPGNHSGLELSELLVVANMHERKQIMFERADAFVALPGGIGTLEELVEMMTWAQLDRHRKPIAILNIDSFWDPFVTLFKHMNEQGFVHALNRVQPVVTETVEEIVVAIQANWNSADAFEQMEIQ